MPRLIHAAIALVLAAGPAAADEFTDTVESALKAYGDGDITGAQQDLDYAGKLLTAMKAESLATYLPAPLAGWTRDESTDAGDAGGFMGMLGGGTTAAATYRKDSEELTITLVANSPMVSGMASMMGGLAGIGGEPMRIQRTEFHQSDQDLQGVVDGKVLISVGGNASIEDKRAYLEAMDFAALAAF